MKVHEITFNHNKCGGVVLIRKLFAQEDDKMIVLGICRACHVDVSIPMTQEELFPHPLPTFSELDTLRLHGLGVSFPNELLLASP